jgi:hypothetical protein
MLQTEYSFTLPIGYVDPEGNLHKEGTMRLATAFDEIAPLKDPRVQSNPAYLLVILLSRVITGLGSLEHINPKMVEALYAADLAWRYPLERLYEEVAYIAFHFHWPHEQVLALEHGERQRWVAEIAKINRRLNEQREGAV